MSAKPNIVKSLPDAMKGPGLIDFESAYRLAQQEAKPLGVVALNIAHVLGRVVAKNIYAHCDYPPFDRSKRDGYACRESDLKKPLKVVAVIAAGCKSTIKIKPGQCAKIMTGAPLPKGADCVVEIEQTRLDNAGRVIFYVDTKDKFIAYRGEDLKRGALLVSRGEVLTAASIAYLASNGIGKVDVYKTPRVVIIATGNELIEPGSIKKKCAQIFNSSAYGLIAGLKQMNINADYHGIVTDDKDKLFTAIKKAGKEADILLVLGGVSMGDYDLVPAALRRAGFKTVFHKVNIEPGKPLLFVKSKSCLCFGMPGNPVSTLVAFELFVKDMILKMQSFVIKERFISLRLTKTAVRKNASRRAFVPAIIKDGECFLLPYHGSGHLASLSKANALVEFPEGVLKLNKGKRVNARPL